MSGTDNKKKKILIVEDDGGVSSFLRLELEHEGYETGTAADGRTGLELCTGGGFDLVLLDIMLPALNGIEVLRRLRRESEIPVIVVTAKDDTADAVTALDAGADGRVDESRAEKAVASLLERCQYGSTALKKAVVCIVTGPEGEKDPVGRLEQEDKQLLLRMRYSFTDVQIVGAPLDAKQGTDILDWLLQHCES